MGRVMLEHLSLIFQVKNKEFVSPDKCECPHQNCLTERKRKEERKKRKEKKGKILYHTFIMSNFNYCPFIWVFCGKTQNKEIDRVHKRALRIFLGAYTLSFDELLQKIDHTRVHVKTLRNLMVGMYKCLSCENPSLMWNIFQRKELTNNLRSGSILMLPQAKTSTYGTSSLTFRRSMLWNSLPDTIKNSPSVVCFKRSIKEWKGKNCTCRNCC